MATPAEISDRIVESVLAKKLAPGARLGELELCALFDCSRAGVREALTRLSVRGIVKASARRGWYLAELAQDEARDAFQARHVIEAGLIRCIKSVDKTTLKRLRSHIARQRAAIEGSDVGLRSFLLGDFHVCLAECVGNRVLANAVRDLTARTTLIAVRCQSEEDATHSFDEHVGIVEALAAGDLALAEQRVSAHLTTWNLKLPIPVDLTPDPLSHLRQALSPVERAR